MADGATAGDLAEAAAGELGRLARGVG
jgi:hypothetical protein